MRKIVYYVAVSIDGYIASPDNDISRFIQDSDGIGQYIDDLKSFDTVIMGRNTYEFGYKFGLKPGELAYPHMEHYIFSNTLKLPSHNNRLHIEAVDIKKVEELQATDGSDIYLCGGGTFAGWLLDNKKIDILKIKLNPIVLGQGVRLFGDSKMPCSLQLDNYKAYSNDLILMEYSVSY